MKEIWKRKIWHTKELKNNELRQMIVVAIGVAEDMWKRGRQESDDNYKSKTDE